MLTTSNPFAALLDPAGVLSACAQSGTLDALPVSAKRCADRTSPTWRPSWPSTTLPSMRSTASWSPRPRRRRPRSRRRRFAP